MKRRRSVTVKGDLVEHYESNDGKKTQPKLMKTKRRNVNILLSNQDEVPNTQILSDDTKSLDEDSNTSQKQLNFQRLKNRNQNSTEDFVPTKLKGKIRAVVDLKMMQEELKQLEDPPVTPKEKELSSNRLPYSFFESYDCKGLAQQLLGKILVRQLENGTVLKGKIVETEAYLGVIDKASHTFGKKVTPRNIPMYMLPGTIYIYMTYGMYHCFNISSQEPKSYVQIRAVEPLIGLDYMELLRNMELKEGTDFKKIVENVNSYKPHELCNDSSKICQAFSINQDDLDTKHISTCNQLWIELDPSNETTMIVATPKLNNKSPELSRYYVLGNPNISGEGCAVLVRGLDPMEGLEQMANERNLKGKSKTTSKEYKRHELCNGPSKLCMAYRLSKEHSKYSLCTWKTLWLENDVSDTSDIKIVRSNRIGIESYGSEWANKPLRYYIYGNKSVSKRDKKAEDTIK